MGVNTIYAQVHQLACEIISAAGCNMMPLYIYRSLFRDKKPESPTVLINVYSDSPVNNQEACTAGLLTGNQALQKEVFHVTATRGYLILGHETAQQIGYIYFPRITPPKLTQPPDTCSTGPKCSASSERQTCHICIQNIYTSRDRVL